jgi:hypothetical protein
MSSCASQRSSEEKTALQREQEEDVHKLWWGISQADTSHCWQSYYGTNTRREEEFETSAQLDRVSTTLGQVKGKSKTSKQVLWLW